MSKRGRKYIDRDDVESRVWWPNVALGSPEGETEFDPKLADNQDRCWFWIGDEGAKVYSRISRGEPPRRALFWHLRYEDWAVKDDAARLHLNEKCNDVRCINPWHFDYSVSSTSPNIRKAADAEVVETLMNDDEVMLGAIKVYTAILDDDPFADGLVNSHGFLVRGGKAWAHWHDGDGELGNPGVVAVLDELLRRVREDDDRAIDLPTADRMLETLKEVARQRREERAAKFGQKLAQLRGDKTASPINRTSRVKPRPRRTR